MKATKCEYHRNGVGGEGFNVVLFTGDTEDDMGRSMVGIVFEAEGQVAVFDTVELVRGNIDFAAGNSWRGDHYEHDLRKYVEAWWSKRAVAKRRARK